MKMKCLPIHVPGAALALVLALMAVSCRPAYRVVSAEGNMVYMDSTWDDRPDAGAAGLIAPYKAKVDSIMSSVVGGSDMAMESGRPESTLSNLIADILRMAAIPVLGRPADMGLINMGGIRAPLPEGNITTENVYEILPFENSLCVLTLKGSVLMQQFENIAARGGEGVSGVRIEISKDRRLLNATVDGKPVDKDKLYTVSTVDYLAEGNDGMKALPQAVERECPPGATVRQLLMEYIKEEAMRGRKISSRMEGRIVYKD